MWNGRFHWGNGFPGPNGMWMTILAKWNAKIVVQILSSKNKKWKPPLQEWIQDYDHSSHWFSIFEIPRFCENHLPHAVEFQRDFDDDFRNFLPQNLSQNPVANNVPLTTVFDRVHRSPSNVSIQTKSSPSNVSIQTLCKCVRIKLNFKCDGI